MPAKRKQILAAILAAGSASRFGAPKQLAEVGGTSLIRRAAITAGQVCGERVVVVTGHHWQTVTQNVASDCKFFAVNESYAEGMGGSIALASRLAEHRTDALLLLLADQPLITAAHLETLIDTWSGGDSDIVATAYADTIGPPVLFPKSTHPLLRQLQGDSGARALLSDARFNTRQVAFEDAAIDIDTVDDLNNIS